MLSVSVVLAHAHAARVLAGTAALVWFSEWAWISLRQIPRRIWFLIPWAILGILTFMNQP